MSQSPRRVWVLPSTDRGSTFPLMAQTIPLVQQHYGRAGLVDRLLTALAESGRDVTHLTRDDLAPFEEFHTGGRESTRELATLAGLEPGMRVIDIGSGIGGPARTLADEAGCRVTGVDLTEEFCNAARVLTERVGLADRVEFQQGDATDLPFGDAGFDAAILEHVTMNIEDKHRLFREVHRVLRPLGRMALYEIIAGENSPVKYPVPWADDERISFLLTGTEMQQPIEDAGFTPLVWRDVSEFAIEWFRNAITAAEHRHSTGHPPLGLNLLMGESAAPKIRNLLLNLEEDRVRVVQAVYESKPSPG